MKTIMREYAETMLAAFGGILLFGILGHCLLSRQGLVMQMIQMWGNGGCA